MSLWELCGGEQPSHGEPDTSVAMDRRFAPKNIKGHPYMKGRNRKKSRAKETQKSKTSLRSIKSSNKVKLEKSEDYEIQAHTSQNKIFHSPVQKNQKKIEHNPERPKHHHHP